jgi:RNA polymerase sigma factor (sigma-70 family)
VKEANMLSDNELIERIRQGEKNLYEQLMRRYNQRLYRIGRSFLHEEEEVEDLMQTTYIKAYENLVQFEQRAQFSTWLIQILINEASLRLKRRNRYQLIHEPDEMDEMDGQTESASHSPLGRLLNNELKEILERSVDHLPDKYRTVFMMREIERMSTAETMACLHLSEANVKVRLNRAKEMLRDFISTYYSREEVFSFHDNRCDRVVNHVFRVISPDIS